MTDKMQVLKYNASEVRVLNREDGLWWVLADVCKALNIKNPSQIAVRLDSDERAMFNIGRQGSTWIVNEPGLYNIILRSDKPEAKSFKRWVTHDVLPTIRKSGKYGSSGMSNYQQIMAETRQRNVQIRSAQLLTRLAERYKGTTYEQVLQAHATKELTGEYLLPLPALPQKTYSATEVGERLGITAQMVGILANRHGLKSERFGQMFKDKARHSSKEVQTFRYYETVFPALERILSQDS